MGRLPRAVDAGLVNRGNNGGDVFAAGADHLAFLKAMVDANERTAERPDVGGPATGPGASPSGGTST